MLNARRDVCTPTMEVYRAKGKNVTAAAGVSGCLWVGAAAAACAFAFRAGILQREQPRRCVAGGVGGRRQSTAATCATDTVCASRASLRSAAPLLPTIVPDHGCSYVHAQKASTIFHITSPLDRTPRCAPSELGQVGVHDASLGCWVAALQGLRCMRGSECCHLTAACDGLQVSTLLPPSSFLLRCATIHTSAIHTSPRRLEKPVYPQMRCNLRNTAAVIVREAFFRQEDTQRRVLKLFCRRCTFWLACYYPVIVPRVDAIHD